MSDLATAVLNAAGIDPTKVTAFTLHADANLGKNYRLTVEYLVRDPVVGHITRTYTLTEETE